jgi:GDP-L-fucose synthase
MRRAKARLPHGSPNGRLPKTSRIFVAGHNGMVGSAILRALEAAGCRNIVTRTRKQLDLADQQAVESFFGRESIDAVFLAAALVGGIHANSTYPADFIYQNLIVECNVLNSAFRHAVRRLLFLGSSCIYPRDTPQPMQEEQLLSGRLEPTNEPYAVAKIAGIKICEAYNRQYGTDFRSVMPTNLYGPNDNFDLSDSHVLPALIRRFHLAKLARTESWAAIDRDADRFGAIPESDHENLHRHRGGRVQLWGTGSAKREFLYVDDLAEACLRIMQLPVARYHALLAGRDRGTCDGNPSKRALNAVSHVNIGFGEDVTIAELADLISGVVGYDGFIEWDSSRPDGMMRKLLDGTRIHTTGWRPRIDLQTGIQKTYRWYLGQTPAV